MIIPPRTLSLILVCLNMYLSLVLMDYFCHLFELKRSKSVVWSQCFTITSKTGPFLWHPPPTKIRINKIDSVSGSRQHFQLQQPSVMNSSNGGNNNRTSDSSSNNDASDHHHDSHHQHRSSSTHHKQSSNSDRTGNIYYSRYHSFIQENNYLSSLVSILNTINQTLKRWVFSTR